MLPDLQAVRVEVVQDCAPLPWISHGVHLQGELLSGLQLLASVRTVTSFSNLLVFGRFKEEELAILDGPKRDGILSME